MATGIKDKVAIIGMGCSRFGERWDCGADDLILEAYGECLADAGVETAQIEAAWLGLCYDEHSLSKSALSLSQTLRLANVPVTRVENLCATGSEALRGAVYAVAAGACDIALAVGVEKLKDTGFGGLPPRAMGHLRGPVAARDHRAGLVRADVHRLCAQPRHCDGAAEGGDGARVVEEPRERRVEPEGTPAQPRGEGKDARRADDRLAARACSTVAASATARRVPS